MHLSVGHHLICLDISFATNSPIPPIQPSATRLTSRLVLIHRIWVAFIVRIYPVNKLPWVSTQDFKWGIRAHGKWLSEAGGPRFVTDATLLSIFVASPYASAACTRLRYQKDKICMAYRIAAFTASVCMHCPTTIVLYTYAYLHYLYLDLSREVKSS